MKRTSKGPQPGCAAFFLVLIGLLISGPASSSVVQLDAQLPQLPLDTHVELLRDPTGQWGWQDIRGPQASQFAPNPDKTINYGFTTDTYWYRVSLQNSTSADRPIQDWVLELGYPPLDEVDIYLTQGERTVRMRAGDQRKPNSALLAHRNIAMPLQMTAGEQVTIHLRVNTSGSHQVPLALWTGKAFFKKTERENLGFGVFYGVLLVMSLYNLCIFLFVRDPAYLYYICVLVSFALMQLNLNGFAHLYFSDWPIGSPRGINLGVPLTVSVTLITSLLFTRSFLNTPVHLPRINLAFYFLIAMEAIAGISSFFLPYSTIVPIAAGLGAVTSIAGLMAGVVALLAKVRIARFYVLAWSLFLAGIVVKVCELFGLLPTSFLTAYSWQIGVLFMVTLLSLALADRITIERKEKIRAQDEALNARNQAIANLERYERMVNNVLEGVFQTDRHGRCISANPAMARMLGFDSAEQLVRANVNLRVDTTVNEKDQDAILDALKRDGQLSGYELKMRRRDGREFWGSLSVRTLLDDHNKVDVNDGILVDISARREKQQLEHAREVAEAATATKSEFLAKMSHELRTPMNAIIGFTDLALRNDSIERKQEHLKHIDTASHSLLAIINDILDLSKIEAGKLTLEAREFALQPILDKLADLFSGQATAKGIELIIANHADVPATLKGDPLRLEQVLMNLVSNAIKFTEKGEVEVAVEKVVKKGEQTEISFMIRDTGIGLSVEQQSRLFTPFSQADQSTTRQYGGTGLGLAICKQLVELMHGHIGIVSRPGEGSCFSFTVNLGIGRDKTGQAALGHVGGKRILVVDDNAAARQVYGRMLDGMQFQTATATNAGEALDMLGKEAFDAVLMDWLMPQTDGIEATRLIRARPETSSLPVILMTAHGREDLIEAAVAAGANNYLEKPVKPSLLLESLQQVLEPQQAGEINGQADVSSNTDRQGLLTGMSVLLVEDNALNRRLAQEILTDAGVQLDMAENGAEGLEAVQANGYDLVLMDVQMPVMDGFEATRAIRKLSGFADLPIIAMTANAMEGDREQCLAAGMNDFVSKPIDAALLLARLQAWRDRIQQSPPKPPSHEG